MSREFIIKKCSKCGNIVRVYNENQKIVCCDGEMRTLVLNSVDAAVEKHVPTYEVKDGKILVKVNHVMEEEHFIEWIAIVSDEKECITYLEPGKDAVAHCKYIPGTVLYSYCNKHGLWKKEVV